MDRKVIALAAALVILAAVAAPASATLPQKNPLPNGQPFGTIWNLLVDLQTQITNLATQVTSLATQVSNIKPTHLGAKTIFESDNPTVQTYSATADSDLIVTAYVQTHVVGNLGVSGDLFGVDPQHPEESTTIVASYGTQAGGLHLESVCFPVAKGDHYQVVWTATTEKVVITLRPLVQ